MVHYEHQAPVVWLYGAVIHALTGWDSGSFSCYAEAAGGCGLGEPLHHIGQSRLEGLAVQPGGRDRFPGDLVLTGPQLLRIAHVGLDSVLDGLGLGGGFLNEGLELPQLPDLALDLVH